MYKIHTIYFHRTSFPAQIRLTVSLRWLDGEQQASGCVLACVLPVQEGPTYNARTLTGIGAHLQYKLSHYY